MVGGYGGAYLGRTIGFYIPLPLAGTVVSYLGGLSGNYLGQVIARSWMNDCYEMKFGAIDKEFGDYVYKRYNVL